jgi:hypothetical protein|tara:strand:- start:3585 stop:3764 length:180 start_codon:yes stop_codon:yes gene_type:complete
MKFLIYWDAGYGEVCEIVDAPSQSHAGKIAYGAWRDDIEDNTNYGVKEDVPEEEWGDYV